MLTELTGTSLTKKQYDFCILGTGPAGITLALNLANKGANVLLLEGGGLDYSQQSQQLYECKAITHNPWPMYSRLRYFGGTSNHWAGRCRPFEESDFIADSVNGLPGWPISFKEVNHYLGDAMDILDLDSVKGFTPINRPLLHKYFKPDAFASSPPTRFKSKYIDTISNHENIDCYYHANAIDLVLDNASQAISQVKVTNFNDVKTNFTADTFICCLGGIENARFLLNCNQQIPAGLGNSSDMVGRCFMEHLNVQLGEFYFDNPDDVSQLQFFSTSEFANDFQLGRSNIAFKIVEGLKSYGRTKAIKNFFKNLSCQLGISDNVQFISDFTCPGTGKISTLMEQSPNRNSRITLGEETDQLGMQKAVIDWQLNERDMQTIRTTAIELAKQFTEAELGSIRLSSFILDDSEEVIFSHHSHHMGTTRMSSNSRHGVVDENLKVHDLENLYIAGSSVFPTGGVGNPTMPLVQLSLRLSDHLSGSTSL